MVPMNVSTRCGNVGGAGSLCAADGMLGRVALAGLKKSLYRERPEELMGDMKTNIVSEAMAMIVARCTAFGRKLLRRGRAESDIGIAEGEVYSF